MFACNRSVLRPIFVAEASGMADLLVLGADDGSAFNFIGLNDVYTRQKITIYIYIFKANGLDRCHTARLPPLVSLRTAIGRSTSQLGWRIF
jgi:hypothetical protein